MTKIFGFEFFDLKMYYPSMPSNSTLGSASLSAAKDFTAVTSSHRRLSFLDAMRGVAAFTVLIQHYGSLLPTFDAWTRFQFNIGQFGVVVFFLVSGFIIPISIQRYSSVSKFWRGRFLRLYPAYWLSLLLTCGFGFFGLADLPLKFHLHPVLAVAANLTMLQRFLGQPDADGAYWTLALELVFYVLCSGLFLRGLLRKPFRNMMFVATIVAAANIFCPLFLHRSPPSVHIGLILTSFVGSVAYSVYMGITPRKELYASVLVALAVMALGIWVRIVLYPVEGKEPGDFHGMFLAWVAAYLTFFLVFERREYHFPSWLQWLGKISYSLYLLHELVPPLLPKSLPWLAMFAIASTLSILLAWAAYKFVERPFMKL